MLVKHHKSNITLITLSENYDKLYSIEDIKKRLIN